LDKTVIRYCDLADKRRAGNLLDNTSEKVEKYMFVHCTYSTYSVGSTTVCFIKSNKKGFKGKIEVIRLRNHNV
jgi:hypothetical protein